MNRLLRTGFSTLALAAACGSPPPPPRKPAAPLVAPKPVVDDDIKPMGRSTARHSPGVREEPKRPMTLISAPVIQFTRCAAHVC